MPLYARTIESYKNAIKICEKSNELLYNGFRVKQQVNCDLNEFKTTLKNL